MRFSVFQDSQLGARRINQDRMGYSFTSESLLLVVADGMGGHQRGEVAAQITLQTIAARFQREARPLIPDPRRFLGEAVIDAHVNILEYTRRERLDDSPRTTVVVALIQHGRAWWVHAGDSRLYWLRDGQILTRTRDHSKVESLLQAGRITAEQSLSHPERNKVHTCLGAPMTPRLSIAEPVTLHQDDVLMLCSDGLWANLASDTLAARLTAVPLPIAVPDLVQQAVQAGGDGCDNVTLLAVHWLETQASDTGRVAPAPAPLTPASNATTAILAASAIQVPSESAESEVESAIFEIEQALARSSNALAAGAKSSEAVLAQGGG